MSLWTPSGEHEVPRDQPRPGGAPAGAPTGGPAGDDWRERLMAGEIDIDQLTPEQRAEVEEAVAEMAAAQRELLATPIEHLIVQHVVGLRELVILHLQQPSPDFKAAQLALDGVAGIVEALGSRLGEYAEPLRLDLQQLQLAFVQRKDEVSGGSS